MGNLLRRGVMEKEIFDLMVETAGLFVRDIRDSIYALKEVDRMMRKYGSQAQLEAWARLISIYWNDIMEDLEVIQGETAQLPLPLGEG
jgi:hypothetical protein